MISKNLLVLTVLAVFLLSTIPAMAVVGGNASALSVKNITTNKNLTKANTGTAAGIHAYTDAKAGYLQAKQNYLDAKTNFIAYRLQFAERDRTAFLKGQTFMVAGVDQLLKYIDSLSSKVNETRAFSDSEKNDLMIELVGYAGTLEADKNSMQAASTIDELRTATNKTRDDWNTIKPQLKRIAGEIILAKAGAVVAKAETASTKLDARITELNAAGKDTTKLEKISAQVKTKIANTKEKVAQAKAKLAEVKSGGNAQGLLTAADQFVKQANRWMLEMQYLLGQAVREIKHLETGQEGPEPNNATVMGKTPMEDDGNETEDD